jgi:DNA polymerase-4
LKSIFFVDPPAFCTTVEQLVAPALRSRPLAVAPPGADRATVLALSSEAEAAGVARGMLVRKARKLCPDLVLLPPNPRLYARASRALGEILRVYAPVIEPRWYGHAFLDLSGTQRLFGPALDVAERIRREARDRLRLPLVVGIAVNKLVSEAATRIGRTDAQRAPTLLVPTGGEAPFLAPHPVELLPGVPDDIRIRLDEYQLERIGQVAVIRESALCAVFGSRGRLLSAQVRGIDARPVLAPEVRAEYRLSHTLGTDTNELAVLHPLLRRLTAALGQRLRRRGLATQRLEVEVEYADYARSARNVAVATLSLDQELWHAAKRGLALALARRIAVRTVTLTAARLVEADAQLELWEEQEPRDSVLQRALDAVVAVNGERLTVNGPPSHPRSPFTVHRSRHASPVPASAPQPLEVAPGEEPELGDRLLRRAVVARIGDHHRDRERPVGHQADAGIDPHALEPARLAGHPRRLRQQTGEVALLGNGEQPEEILAPRGRQQAGAPERFEQRDQLPRRGGVLAAGARRREVEHGPAQPGGGQAERVEQGVDPLQPHAADQHVGRAVVAHARHQHRQVAVGEPGDAGREPREQVAARQKVGAVDLVAVRQPGAARGILAIQLRQDRELDGARRRHHLVGVQQEGPAVAQVLDRHREHSVEPRVELGDGALQLAPQQRGLLAGGRPGGRGLPGERRGQQQRREDGGRKTHDASYQARISLPTPALRSISRCATATSAKGNTA